MSTLHPCFLGVNTMLAEAADAGQHRVSPFSETSRTGKGIKTESRLLVSRAGGGRGWGGTA